MNIRPATLTDVPQILILVNDHVRRGDLLPRTAQSIRDTIGDWLVGEQDSDIVACVSLLHYTPVLAEVRSLAVSDIVKGQGWGSAIMDAIIQKAEREEVPTLFALTRAVHFFEKSGFDVTVKERFPQKVYRDCHICPLLENCDETAVILELIE